MRFSTDRQFRRARIWSNEELRKLAPLFDGAVVNASGWKDEDKEGSFYREYFYNASSYSVTNYGGTHGFQGAEGELLLDLEQPLPDSLVGRFDVVFNHTVLEHIFDFTTAFGNLCKMARQAVIVVVPFAQVEHWSGSYGDYWRFSGQALDRMFRNNDFSLAYCSSNRSPNEAVYVLAVGVRHPEKWSTRLPAFSQERPLADWIGRPSFWKRLVRLVVRKIGLSYASC